MPRSAAVLASPDPERDDPPAAPNTSFSALVGALRISDLCKECGKTRAVLNVAGYRRPFRAEKIDPRIHCACPGGPAYVAPKPAPIDLEALVVEVLDAGVQVGGQVGRLFDTMDDACAAVVARVSRHIGRPLEDGELAKVYIATGSDFNRRRAAVQLSQDGAR